MLSPGKLVRAKVGGITNEYSYDFGPVSAGSSKAQTFTVSNTGTGTTETLLLEGGNQPPAFTNSSDTCTGQALAPNGTCTFEETFTPPAVCVPSGTSVFTRVDMGLLAEPGGRFAYVGFTRGEMQGECQ